MMTPCPTSYNPLRSVQMVLSLCSHRFNLLILQMLSTLPAVLESCPSPVNHCLHPSILCPQSDIHSDPLPLCVHLVVLCIGCKNDYLTAMKDLQSSVCAARAERSPTRRCGTLLNRCGLCWTAQIKAAVCHLPPLALTL
jgi:hypothetical protein